MCSVAAMRHANVIEPGDMSRQKLVVLARRRSHRIDQFFAVALSALSESARQCKRRAYFFVNTESMQNAINAIACSTRSHCRTG